ASTCNDMVKDGNETDVDCGGSCGGCAIGKACAGIDANCQSGFCQAGTKTSVTTGYAFAKKDGNETGFDCGGSTSSKCGSGVFCLSNGDCTSGLFFPTRPSSGVASSCNDMVKDGNETDVDCGGSCGGCAIGKACAGVDANCQSGFC